MGIFKSGGDEDDTDRLLDAAGRSLAGSVCRAKFTEGGKRKTCTRRKGHRGKHKQ